MKYIKNAFLLIILVLFCFSLAACFWDNEEINHSDTAKLPYQIQINRTDTPIFAGPGYDYAFKQMLAEPGLYTITEEQVDYETILWGKLDSCDGWIDLALASQEAEPALMWVDYADEELEGNYHEFIAEDSQYLVKIAFNANEPLSEVQFSLLDYNDDGSYKVAENLYTLEELTVDMPLVCGVVFYGDLTAYGISFNDSAEQRHHFAVYISGRNGQIILSEYEI